MEYRINETEKSVVYNDETFYLPKKEFRLMEYLYNNPNKVLTREVILENVWGNDVIVGDRTIDVHIRRLRKTFPNIPIVTRKCYGYIWKQPTL